MFDRNFTPLTHLVDEGSPGNRTAQRLAGTGATEASNSRALIVGKVHVLNVGAAGVRVRFSRARGAASAVDATRDPVYGPWTRLPFVPEDSGTYGSTFVYIEAADGAAAYEATVVQVQP